MNWYRSLSGLEIAFVVLFVGAYGAYLYRIVRLARYLGTEKRYLLAKGILRCVYFGLIIAALLGPSFGRIKQEVKAMGKDIFLAVDVSESMDAYDVAPSRLEKVRFELRSLLNLLQGDRLGLVVFTDEAFLQCPLTFDQGALSLFVESLSTKVVNGGSTDLSAPLRLIAQKYGQEGQGESARAVVLVSDGEDFGEKYGQVLDELQAAGIKVFCVGVGTQSGGPIPMGSRFKLDEEGRQVITHLTPGPLGEIARATGGRYYELTDRANGFPALGRELQALQGQVIEVKKLDVAANKYTFALAIALILALIDVLVPVRVLRLKR